MRHLQIGRKLGVDHSHRKALLRSLSLALIEYDFIRTTPARAKELRWFADRIVTLAKKGDLASRRQIVQILGSTQNTGKGNRVRLAIERVYSDLVPRFKTRTGGYTQIVRMATRRAGDNAEMCVMRYLPPAEEKKGGAKKKDGGKDKEAKKKAEAKGGKSEAKHAHSDKEHKHDHKHDHAHDHKHEDHDDKKAKGKKKDKED